MEGKHFMFKHPFTCIVAGPTGSGKTYLIRNMLLHHKHVFANLPKLKVLWCYGQWQDLYSMKIVGVSVNYVEGLPGPETLKAYNLIIIDDLMSELGNDKNMANLFTKGSHHLNLSVIFITQNLFHQGKEMRNIGLNAHYYILLKNPRDQSQIVHLGRQMFPGRKGFLTEAYQNATRRPYGELVIDCKPDTPDEVRVRTNILPKLIKGKSSCSTVVYCPQ